MAFNWLKKKRKFHKARIESELDKSPTNWNKVWYSTGFNLGSDKSYTKRLYNSDKETLPYEVYKTDRLIKKGCLAGYRAKCVYYKSRKKKNK